MKERLWLAALFVILATGVFARARAKAEGWSGCCEPYYCTGDGVSGCDGAPNCDFDDDVCCQYSLC
jgi:hypothetical protein